MRKCGQFMIALAFLVFGFVFTEFWWRFYNTAVLSHLPLTNRSDSQAFRTWSNDSSSPYLQFSIYMFNWTNPRSSLANKEKPNFQQVGPYVYRVEVFRKDFVWNSNGTITYSTGQRYHFVPELSDGDPQTDIITSPNVVLIAVSRHLTTLSKLLKIGLNQMFRKNGLRLYIRRTAQQLLFDGYEVKMLDWLKPFSNYVPLLKTLPERFAWFLLKNCTQTDTFNVHTGQNGLAKLGLLYAYNYSTGVPAFEGSCSRVRGSPGEFWPVDVTRKENASLFIPDFCSSLQLQRQSVHIVGGIDGIKFEGDEMTFDNGTRYAKTACYCPNRECKWRSGVRDMSSCVKAPVFLSFPHFYAADPSYLNGVNGLEPTKERHCFYMTFQKDYGLLLNGAARLQMNVHLKPIPDLELFENVPNIFLPALWFEESVQLSPGVLTELHLWFTIVPSVLSILGPISVIIGSTIILLLEVSLCARHHKQTKKKRRPIPLPNHPSFQ